MLQQSKESGVDLDFDEIMASSSSQKDHSLKSPYAYTRSAVPSLPPDASAVRPPRPQFPSMTNLKQQLQRHQAEQEEKRLRDLHASLGTPRASSAIRVPSIPDRLPPNLHVPTEILQVESRLENPTRYHVEQSKKRQVQQFLSSRTMLPQAQVQRLVAPPMTPGPTGSPFSPDSPVSHPHSGSGATSNSERRADKRKTDAFQSNALSSQCGQRPGGSIPSQKGKPWAGPSILSVSQTKRSSVVDPCLVGPL